MNRIRGFGKIRELTVLVGWVGCLLLQCAFWGGLSAQDLRGKVYSVDEKGDTVAVYMARLQWLNTSVGTYTNPRGSYRLPFAKTDTLLVSYSFFKPDTLIITSDIKQRNIYLNMTQPLQEVVVSKRKKSKYVRKGNPAVLLVENVIARKDSNYIDFADSYKSKIYKKMVMSFGRFDMNFQKNSFNRQLSFLEKYIDTIRTDTVPVLAFSIREFLLDRYYQKSPHKNINYVTAKRMQGIDEVLQEEGRGVNLDAMFAEVNIFENNIDLMLNRFVSPLSSTIGTLYYHYFITDTLLVDSIPCIELSFSPVNSRTFGFTGRLYIVNDGTYALKKYAINVPIDINMNYVKRLIVEQDYKKIDSIGLWVPNTSETFASFVIIKRKKKKQRQVYIRQNTIYYQYEIGASIPDSLSSKGGEVVASDAEKYKRWQWGMMRPEPLTRQESVIDSLSSEFRRLPAYKVLEKTAEIIATGYIPITKKRKDSPLDIGTIYDMISYNPTEGLRLRVGAMTTAKLDDRLFLTGYVAFGCKDLRFKYNATMIYSFVKKERHYNEFPRHALYLSTSYDMEMIGQSFSYMDRDNILMSYTVDSLSSSSQYVRRHKLRYLREWKNKFSIDTWFQYESSEGAGTLNYWRINPDGTTTRINDYQNMEWAVKIRWAPGERIYNNQSGKGDMLRLAKSPAVLQLTHTFGLLGGLDWYNRTELSVEKRFGLSAFGYIDVLAQGGIVWNAVPFPKLFVPQSNQSWFLTPNTFCLMKPMEFIMDKYIGLYATYHLKGWIFNRIPLWNRLHFREVISFSGVYGGLSAKNTPSPSTPGLYVLPDGCSPMGKVPYMEITAGIENILQVLRIDYVRRLTYAKDLTGWGKNGVRVSLEISF
jgi:hypothetical protein